MERNTSVSADGSEIRARVGLQFFAEAEGGEPDGGADMDGFDGDAFEAGLFDGGGEDQPAAEQTGSEHEDGGESQPAASAPENAERENQTQTQEQQEETPGEEQTPDEAPPPAAQTVPLRYNGAEIPLPAAAVEALTGALGKNPIELLQKGMNYEAKAARELRLLDEYAKASGLDRAAYLAQLETNIVQQRVQAEAERVKAQYPGTPDEAALQMARQHVDAEKAAERARAEQAQLAAQQQRIKGMVEETRQAAQTKAWDAYEQVSGVHHPWDIPERVMALVNEGYTPREAHFAFAAEQARAQAQQAATIRKKEQENNTQTTGSMAGAGGDMSDPFLRGLLGEG